MKPEIEECIVYLIRCKNTSYYKIGHTGDLEARMGDLQVANPHELEVIGIIDADDKEEGLSIEKRLHLAFRKYRLHGEWFDFKNRDIVWLKRNICRLTKEVAPFSDLSLWE